MRTTLSATLGLALVLPPTLLPQDLHMDDLVKVAGTVAQGKPTSAAPAAPRYGRSYRQDILDILTVVAATEESISAARKLEGVERASSAPYREAIERIDQRRAQAAKAAATFLKLAGGMALLGTAATVGAYDHAFEGGRLTRAYVAPALNLAGAAAAAYGLHRFMDSRAPIAAASEAPALPSNPAASLTLEAIERLEAEGGSHIADLVAYQRVFTDKVNELILACHTDPASRLRVQAKSLVFGAPTSADDSLIKALVFLVDGQLVTVTLSQLESYLRDDFRSLVASRRAAVEDATRLTLPATYARMEQELGQALKAELDDLEDQQRKLGVWKTQFVPTKETALRSARIDQLSGQRRTAEGNARAFEAYGRSLIGRDQLVRLEAAVAAGARIQTQAAMELRRAERAAHLMGLLDKGRALAALAKIRKMV